MKLVVFSNARPGMDDEFDRWYGEVHLKDMLEVPGVRSGERFYAQALGRTQPEYRYMAVYEIDDADAVIREIMTRSADGRFQLSDSVDPAQTKMTVWTSPTP
jgi:hypothetical protein